MVTTICDILKYSLTGLDWLERFAGLAMPATRTLYTAGADGKQIETGQQTFPVSCGVNAENCWDNQLFKVLEPDSKKAAIAFFTDSGGVQTREIIGPGLKKIRFSFSVRFLCWLNVKRLEGTLPANYCVASGILAPYVMGQLMGEHDAGDVFGPNSIEGSIYQNFSVDSIRELVKTPSIFDPFTFAMDGEKRNLFIYPYDYFGLQIDGQFTMNLDCLPTMETILSSLSCVPHPTEGDVWRQEDRAAWLGEAPNKPVWA